MKNKNVTELLSKHAIPGFQFEDMYISNTGNVYKIAQDGKSLLPRSTSVSFTELVSFQLKGKAINLPKLIALWYYLEKPRKVTIKDYLNNKRVWYIHVNKVRTDCSFKNIKTILKNEKTEPKRKQILSRIWAIRDMFLSGIGIREISDQLGVTENYVKTLCAGFDGMSKQNINKLKEICNAEKEK